MASIETLVERGFEAKPRLLEFRRQVAELEGMRQSSAALAARARQKIGEARLEISQKIQERSAVRGGFSTARCS